MLNSWRTPTLKGVAVVLIVLASISSGVRGLTQDQAPATVEHRKGVVRHPAEESDKIVVDQLRAFRGLSTWIDTYDTDMSVEEQVSIARDAGVNTVFVQSARESTPGLIHDPQRLASTIEGAHDAGMQVMVWTIPDFEDLAANRERALAAMQFTTPRGDTADAFGLDIEVTDIEWAPIRTRRLLQLSRELRTIVGPDYPMAAIVLAPLQLELNPRWWRDFPYAELAALYDVTIPMSYSSYRGADAVTTYEWNRENVLLTRQLAGDEDLPVHLAGGIADALPNITAFVRAAVAGEVIGAGLYDLHTTQSQAWATLRVLRHEPTVQDE